MDNIIFCYFLIELIGHCHPHVVNAIKNQAEKLLHGQVSVVLHTPMLDLVKKLLEITPSSLDTFFFWNSGAEAVEASIKLARHATNKPNIIVFDGSFHGRTVGTMSLTTSKTIYRAGYGPLMPGVAVSSFPYLYRAHKRYGKNYTEDQCVSHSLEDLEVLLHTQCAPSETAALLIEPVLGEGGYIPAPKSFLQGLREISKKHKILLIADEVQSGFGRTGTYFTIEQSSVIPDILIFAKGVASGMPLSGIVSTQELMSKQPAGSMGGTYAGNAVSCAAAVATIEVFQRDNILENVRVRSKQLISGLRSLKEKYPDVIGDVRGLGLMIGVEFAYQKEYIASKISKHCLGNNLMLLTCSIYDTIRFIPPLTVSAEEIQIALKTFENALKAIAQ